ncbi:MAG: 50S ribosomal protein L29 [Candidatus Microgenomates bacterium]|jgi:ribosomal protein L29
MKRKDFTELKGKTAEELVKLASQKKLETMKVKMEILGGKEKNLKAYRNLRVELAKILTLIREKEILAKLAPKVEKKAEKVEKTEK